MKTNPLASAARVSLAIGALLLNFGLVAEQPADVEHASTPYRGIHKMHDPAAAPATLATTGHLIYYGGKVISTVEVVNVNWGPNTDTTVTSNMGAFYAAVTNSAYFDWLSEYNTVGLNGQDGQPGSNQTIGRGTYKASYTITPTNTSSSVTDAQIQTELQGQITAGHLPAPTLDAQGNAITIYMVNFPSSMTEHDPSGGSNCVQFCAYHGTMTINGKSVAYGVLPDLGGGCATGCGSSTKFNNSTSVASHELIEAVTDLEVGIGSTVGRPLAWYDSTNGEIGDICNASQGSIAGYTVQKEWSNSQNACIVSVASSGNNFSMSMSPSSQTVAAGSSVSYTVSTTVTSGSAESLSLSVSGLPSGVTGSFSPSTVTAGNSATLTLTASSSAAAATGVSFTVTATGASASHTASAQVTVTTSSGGGDIALSSGVAKSGSVSGSTANAGWVYYTIVVPSGATNLSVSLSGLSADADLYDMAPSTAGGTASHPTTSTYTGRSWNGGTTAESLSHANPIAGTWSIAVTNYATGTISYTVTATVTASSGSTYSIAGSAGTASATVTAGSKSATSDSSNNYSIAGLSAGTYTVTPSKSGCTFSPASQSVTITSANVSGINFTASCGTGATTLLSDGFEAGGWSAVDTSGTAGNWTIVTSSSYPSISAHGGTHWADFNSYTSSSGSKTRFQRTATLAIPSSYTTVTLKFWMYHDTGYSSYNDQVQAQIGVGSTWTNVGSAVSRYNGATGWAQVSVDISSYKGQTVNLGFLGISGYGNDEYLDDVTVIAQ